MHWPWTQDLKDIFMVLLVSSARDQTQKSEQWLKVAQREGLSDLSAHFLKKSQGMMLIISAPLLLTMILGERHLNIYVYRVI